MLGWLLDWFMWLGWYALCVGGWWCWWHASRRASRLERERDTALKINW